MHGVIYMITNSIDNRVYIGSSIDYCRRKSEHYNNLRNNRHHNVHLQRFYNKHGKDSLFFVVLNRCNNEDLLLLEKFYMNQYSNKFNISKDTTAPMRGMKHTSNAIKKISASSSGARNGMYGQKRPRWLIEKMQKYRGKHRTVKEKAMRLINLPIRKELILEQGDIIYYTFSIAHAAQILGVTSQSVSNALNKKNNCKGFSVKETSKKYGMNNLHEVMNIMSNQFVNN